MSGSMSSRGPGGKSALFKSPTFSSNSEANTEEGRLMEAACSHFSFNLLLSFQCLLLIIKLSQPLANQFFFTSFLGNWHVSHC
uniref:Uncharacterized protein n=1 Tax=Neolamprologus brichardi TaxID=32507 RepID=A0A3Q4M9Q3_NEOBR